MHILSCILVKSDIAIAAEHKGANDIFCISLEWLNAVFGKEIALAGLKITKKMHFRVTIPMFRNPETEEEGLRCLHHHTRHFFSL